MRLSRKHSMTREGRVPQGPQERSGESRPFCRLEHPRGPRSRPLDGRASSPPARWARPTTATGCGAASGRSSAATATRLAGTPIVFSSPFPAGAVPGRPTPSSRKDWLKQARRLGPDAETRRPVTFLIRLVIRFYQRFLNPVLHALAGPLAGCRYQPTCSHYFLQAVERHGPWKGSWYRDPPDFPLSSVGWPWL